MRRRKDSWVEKKEPLNPNRKTPRKIETAEYLKNIMKENSLEDKDIAQLLEVVESTVRGYKNATREIPKNKLMILEKNFSNTYNSDYRVEDAFTIKYKLLNFLKKYNINDDEQFKCVQGVLLNEINKNFEQEFTNKEIEEGMTYYNDESVHQKHIKDKKLLENICKRI